MGWLRRCWEVQLSRARYDDRTDRADRRGYLLDGPAPEVLEPFVDVGSIRPESPFLTVDGLDATAAAGLLDALPRSALQPDWSTFAPSPATLLRVVAAHPGALTCGGDLVGPLLPAEGLRLLGLTARDVSVADVEPDVLPGALGSWLDELPAVQYAEYLRERQACLEHGRTRQGWASTSARYGIYDARSHPLVETQTDPTGTDHTSGTTHLVFRW